MDGDERGRLYRVWRGGSNYGQYQICPGCQEAVYCRGRTRKMTCFPCWLESTHGRQSLRVAGIKRRKLGVSRKSSKAQAAKKASGRVSRPKSSGGEKPASSERIVYAEDLY